MSINIILNNASLKGNAKNKNKINILDLESIDNSYKEIMVKSVKRNGLNIKNVPYESRERELVKEALKQNGMSLK